MLYDEVGPKCTRSHIQKVPICYSFNIRFQKIYCSDKFVGTAVSTVYLVLKMENKLGLSWAKLSSSCVKLIRSYDMLS